MKIWCSDILVDVHWPPLIHRGSRGSRSLGSTFPFSLIWLTPDNLFHPLEFSAAQLLRLSISIKSFDAEVIQLELFIIFFCIVQQNILKCFFANIQTEIWPKGNATKHYILPIGAKMWNSMASITFSWLVWKPYFLWLP